MTEKREFRCDRDLNATNTITGFERTDAPLRHRFLLRYEAPKPDVREVIAAEFDVLAVAVNKLIEGRDRQRAAAKQRKIKALVDRAADRIENPERYRKTLREKILGTEVKP